MFGFGKKKEKETVAAAGAASIDDAKIPSGMKETAARMNCSGLLKMVPGMSGAVSAMKEKIKDGSVDAQIKILEAMTPEERANPEKIFANAKARIAETAGCTVRDVEHIIKQHAKMKQQMAMIQRMGGMEAVMQKMQAAQGGAAGMPGAPTMPGGLK